MKDKLINRLSLPEDIKKLNIQQLNQLASEIREFLITSVSQTGGHLASNLGVVELTIAMHYVFESPSDQFVFDVGHQSYVHKILTGRMHGFTSLRKDGGLSGFPNPEESVHDVFKMGHSSTSLSLGLGLSFADQINGKNSSVVALIGDGAMTGGMAYEAMCNISNTKNRLIVILNDNKMSISKNVGFMARYLAKIRAKPRYYRFKDNTKGLLEKIPLIGKYLSRFVSFVKTWFKIMIYHSNLFESFGMTYLGPADGHDLQELINVLTRAKQLGKPALIHAITKKGKGYSFAEHAPQLYHGISSFDVETGMTSSNASDSFSSKFGELLCHMLDENKKIQVITAAMCEGCGLDDVAKQYPRHLVDVGIAEGHAITFAAGLAKNGVLPIFAVYSSFLQRGYDQLIHDISLQNQHVVFAIDRCGIVGSDGETHQGLFDVVFLNSIPDFTVFAPATYKELSLQFEKLCYENDGAGAVRYPRGSEVAGGLPFKESAANYEMIERESDVLIVTYGRQIEQVIKATERLAKQPSVIKINRIIPLDEALIQKALSYKTIFFYEEGYSFGGIGSAMCQKLSENGYCGKFSVIGIPNQYVKHALYDQILAKYRLDHESIYNDLKDILS